ncbi:MAG: glucose dehydrogenase [Rickettsiales bacterium]|nr:glucose dehydrogenase [Rickettsiales bacterium]RPG15506.1 MAG: PQQ-dependent sugar dehydrogenase [Pelagibacteraceae bacterium TMED195]|tara:strand:- start:6273 stop:7445 length:1173 start_codon:yes stop_codon:yes gene_type:complete
MFLKNYFLILLIFLSSNIPMAQDKFSNFKKYPKTNQKFKLVKVTEKLNYPWGMTFIDKEHLLVTEKNGRLLKINIKTGLKKEIKHEIQSIKFKNEKKISTQQGGLLDVLYDNGWVYFSYSHTFEKNNLDDRSSGRFSSTAIARGILKDDKILNLKVLFIAKPKLISGKHFGSRMVIKDEFIFASFGDRGLGMIAQDPEKHHGSIIRIKTDGSIPSDNPKAKGKKNWLSEIYQIGLRNPQGMTINPNNNRIYFSNHGPRGGDSIGVIKFGGNYGWKEIAWGGTEYIGTKIGKSALNNIYDDPVKIWVPSIGAGNLTFYNGKTFPDWQGDLLVTATGSKMLVRINFDNEKVIGEEFILKDEIGRVRDLEVDIDGDIYLISDEFNSKLWKITK